MVLIRRSSPKSFEAPLDEAKGPADKYSEEGAIRQVEIQIRKFDNDSIVKTIPFRGPLPFHRLRPQPQAPDHGDPLGRRIDLRY